MTNKQRVDRRKHLSRPELEEYNIMVQKIQELYNTITAQEWSKELRSIDNDGETAICLRTKNAPIHDYGLTSINYSVEKKTYYLINSRKEQYVTGDLQMMVDYLKDRVSD